MLELLGVAGGVSSAEMFGAWRAFFEALPARGTVVLVFEDVHWADRAPWTSSTTWSSGARDFPIHIVTLARPEILEERPEWGSAARLLERLPRTHRRAAMRELLDGIAPDLPEATVTSIVSQAEGIPSRRRDPAHAHQHRQAQARRTMAPVPAERRRGRDRVRRRSRRSSAPARRPDAADRALLLDAAVLGTSFTPDALAAVSGRGAAELRRGSRS